MPVRDEFLAMIYDNLADCYEKDELFDIAIDAYREAYQILKGGSQQTYPLRGIARMCLLQNKKDSALFYYHQALDCALAEQDSSLIGLFIMILLWLIMKRRIIFKQINMYQRQLWYKGKMLSMSVYQKLKLC